MQRHFRGAENFISVELLFLAHTARGTDLSETSAEAWRKSLIKPADCGVPEKLNEVRLCEAVRARSSYKDREQSERSRPKLKPGSEPQQPLLVGTEPLATSISANSSGKKKNQRKQQRGHVYPNRHDELWHCRKDCRRSETRHVRVPSEISHFWTDSLLTSTDPPV